jgi:cell division protein FtsI (penicillin-binding protein 3)
MSLREGTGKMTPPGAQAPREISFARMLILKIGLLLFFTIVALRLVHIQVLEAPRYQEIARKQYEAKMILPAERGNIYDRNGKILVSNSIQPSYGADPRIVGKNVGDVAATFSRVLGEPRSFYTEKFDDPGRRFVWLKRRVNPEVARRLDISSLEGVIQVSEPRRIYHYESVGGQLLGFTDVDNRGLSGIELQFEKQLSGVNGYVIMQRDGLGRRRPSVDYPRVDPTNGNNIVLTIDLEYQSIAESELRKGIERNQAESGLVLMLEPSTGAILAMANYPGIDPNNIEGVNPAFFKNRVITDMFEPGSVFKIVTASAAIENSLVRLDQQFFAENGKYTIVLAGGKTRDITDTHPYGMLTFQEAMEHSSNIVMAKISDRIGDELLYRTARNFGFGIETGVDLPGEVRGELKRPNLWSGTTLNSMAIGYEVGVTPIQIASAYAAIANNGVLMKPYILKQELNQHNEVMAETTPQQIRRVVAKSTAQMMTRIFQGVVERGTGASARHEFISVAGKTGTSRKFVDGKYEVGNYTASFVGFLPADDPKVVCLVMLDHPKVGGYTGGLASAPIFRAIAEKIVVSSSWTQKADQNVMANQRRVVVPDVTGLDVEVATSMLEGNGFDVQEFGGGRVVLRQSPNPGTRTLPGTAIKVTTNEKDATAPKGFAVVPDVRGMTIRRAINRLTMNDLDVAIAGSGVVVSQFPSAGAQVKVGTRVEIRCEAKSVALAVLK